MSRLKHFGRGLFLLNFGYSRTSVLLSLVFSLLSGLDAVFAQIRYSWRSDSPPGDLWWSTPSNWVRIDTLAAEAPTGYEIIMFTNSHKAMVSTNNLSITNRFRLWLTNNAAARAVTGILENTFHALGTNGPWIANYSTNDLTIAFPVRSGSTNFQLLPLSGSIIFHNIELGGNGARIWGNNTNAGVVFRGPVSGSMAGTLRLASNTWARFEWPPNYSGETRVEGGVLEYGVSGGPTHTNTIFLGSSNGTPAMLRFLAGGITISNPIVTEPGSTAARSVNLAQTGTVISLGGIVLSSPLTITGLSPSAQWNLQGPISGTGSVVKWGPGSVATLGTNSISGSITIWSGVWQVAGSALNTGPYTVNGGTLRFDVTPGPNHTNVITLALNSPQLAFGGSNVTISNPLQIASGGNGIRWIVNQSTGIVTYAGDVVFGQNTWFSNSLGGILRFRGTSDIVVGGRVFTVETNSSVWFEAPIISGSLNKRGPGELVLGHTNWFMHLNVDGGIVRLTGVIATIRGEYRIGPNVGASNAYFIIEDAGLTVTNPIVVRQVGERVIETRHITGTSMLRGPVSLTTSAVFRIAGNGVLGVSNLVLGNGHLLKTGPGRLDLFENNLFNGNSWISQGVVRIFANNALGSTAGSNTVIAGAALEITNNLVIPERNVLNGSGVGGLGALRHLGGQARLTGTTLIQSPSLVRVEANSLTFQGSVLGTSALTCTGSGDLIFSNFHPLAGPVILEGGTTYLRGHLSNAPVTVSGGAILVGSGTVQSLSLNGWLDIGPASNTVGQLRALGASTLHTSCTWMVNVGNATGSIPGLHWDFLNISGFALTIGATPSQPVTLRVAGNPTAFVNSATYSWMIATAATVVGFAPNHFAIDSSSFVPPLNGGSFSVTATATAIYLRYLPGLLAPSNISIVADGPQMVRLSWNPGGSAETIVTHNETNPPPLLTSGTPYFPGDSLGGGARVIYRGSATSLEHVVRAGSFNQYRIHSSTGTIYSFGVLAGTNTPYHPSPIAENFSYTNGVALGGLDGGIGWAGAWPVGPGSYTAAQVQVQLPSNYFPRGGNALHLPPPGVNADATRIRPFGQTFSTGSLYVSFTVRASLVNGNRRVGILLISNLMPRLFIGVPANTNVFGIQENISSNGAMTSISVNTNMFYTLIARYTFSNRQFALNVYTPSNVVPGNEPVSWDADYVVPAAVAPQSINALALHVRSWSGADSGATTFDEIRVAPSFTQLLASVAISITNFNVDGDFQVSDEQLRLGNYGITATFLHPDGMTNTLTLPHVDLLGPTGTVLFSNILLTNLTYSGGGTVLTAINAQQPPLSPSDVVLGVHTVRLSAINSKGQLIIDQPYDASGQPLSFSVHDDDDEEPTTADLFFQGIYSDRTLLFTGFETNESWPAFLTGGSTWTQTIVVGSATGIWVGTCGLTPGGAAAGLNKLVFPASPTGAYVQLPPRAAVGRIALDARLDGGTNSSMLVLERWTGSAWDSLGTNQITSTQYVKYAWAVGTAATSVYRLVRVGPTGAPPLAVDHIEVIADGSLEDPENSGWTNKTDITLSWAPARDNLSPIAEYRLVPPSFGSSPPLGTNDGIGIGAGITNLSITLSNASGIVTGWIAAIDQDIDRLQDRLMSEPRSFIVRIDTNPPPAVQDVDIVSDPLIDDATEMRIEWTPASSNAHEAAGWRTLDQEPLSPWDTYVIRVYQYDTNGNPVSTTLLTRTSGYPELASNNTTTIIISNLLEDTDYGILISGRDRAGNEGPGLLITGRTESASFGIVQGIAVSGSPTNVIHLTVTGTPNKVYDVVYVDALSFTNGLSNEWDIIWSVTTTPISVLTDVGGFNATNRFRPVPEAMGRTMRFYRVAGQQKWKAGVHPQRRSSPAVYVKKTLRLVPGENWHSLFFEPDTNTVAHIFGLDRLPASLTYANATRIYWFAPTNIGGTYNFATNVIGLYGDGISNTWRRWTNDWGPSANEMPVPLHQGFMIELPSSAPTTMLSLVGRVKTNSIVVQIPGRPPGASNDYYWIMSWNYPYRLSLNEMSLAGSGISATPLPTQSDEIRILRNRGMGSVEHPKIRARMTNQWNWRIFAYSTNEFSSPPNPNTKVIEPDDAIIFVRRTTNTIYWTNKFYYSVPGTQFNP
ncbi:MAG: hypothetical protein NZ740_00565 [Kiritimatiellae bacterium]|nr:hypothetical protein [Kiritimatiellia bacterium]MDW8457582.1 hypothetical protein [Verrucomicrobiota bacterium]